MQLLNRKTAAIFLALSTVPAVAKAEVVNFTYTADELQTAVKREALVARIEDHSRKACRSSSPLVSKEAKASCAIDLAEQFVRAINDERLARLAASRVETSYRTALR